MILPEDTNTLSREPERERRREEKGERILPQAPHNFSLLYFSFLLEICAATHARHIFQLSGSGTQTTQLGIWDPCHRSTLKFKYLPSNMYLSIITLRNVRNIMILAQNRERLQNKERKAADIQTTLLHSQPITSFPSGREKNYHNYFLHFNNLPLLHFMPLFLLLFYSFSFSSNFLTLFPSTIP